MNNKNPLLDLLTKQIGGKEGKNGKHFNPADLAEFLFKNLNGHGVNWEDGLTGDCALGELFLAQHIGSFKDFYFEFAQELYEGLKNAPKKRLWFGDMDDYITLIHDTPTKKVFYFENTCSCADVVKWILVWDINEFKSEIHVREINERSDYPRKQYPKKLGLKFYKDRQFIIDYVEKHHMTKLGGVYGDIRDSGYVISYEKYGMGNANAEIQNHFVKLNESIKDKFSLFYYYSAWRNFTRTLKYILKDFKNGKGQ